MKNMTMLILSCDKFSDLWDGHMKLLEQNWPDRDMTTYLVTDAPSEKQYPGVKILPAGTETEWSDRLAYALQLVKTEYVFITLDDYFLIHSVDDRKIADLLTMMEREKIDYVRLFPRPKKATKEALPGYAGIRRIDTSYNYSVNLYSGLWKKAFLESTVKKPKNAWQFEVSLHLRAQEYGAKCVVSGRNEYAILDVVRKGKLLHRSAAYFRKHPGIYEGNREVNTWAFEIKLTMQQLAARHLPTPIKNKVKAFMKKRGRHYYSDDAE
ncbi:MAG: hypothetical protein IJP98_03465 [Clostridia bacterium]|nr:hypothetical protein [Clostridia bacterium]